MKKHSRKSSHRSLSSLSAQVQSLEPRTLPAGTVVANISGGNITLNGDRFANFIEVDLTSSGIFVRGLDGTNVKFGVRTITDGSPLKLAPAPRVTTDMVINLKDGNDGVSIVTQETSAVIGRNLKIDTGRGTDFVEIFMEDGSLTVGNELDIKLGDDSDYLLLTSNDLFEEEDLPDNHEESETAPFHVNKTVKINSGTGDDIVGVDFFSTGGNVQIETGHGDDTVGIENTRIGGNAVISTGSGDDDVGIAFVLVEGSSSITTGSGNDRVGTFNTHSQGTAIVLLQQGNDTLAAAGELSVGEDALVVLSGGSGVDEVDTLAADPESDLAAQALVIGFEAFNSPELAFDILDDVFDEIFGVEDV